MCHGALRIEARSFLEGADCSAMIETMKQRQALVEITLRLSALCRDLTRVIAESLVKGFGRIAACAKDEREKSAGNCMTGASHNLNRV
jgi:hypothetical protein